MKQNIIDAFSPETDGLMRVLHATATRTFAQAPAALFNVYTRWAQYENWSPSTQGPAHWLVLNKNGPGSRFVLYDKPGKRHLVHFGEVTALDHPRYFAWRAPFSEWQRAYISAKVEFRPTASGGTTVYETIYFEAQEDHQAILSAFLNTPGYDAATFTAFLGARLAGLARLLDDGAFSDEEMSFNFAENRVVAADWSGRISSGDWVRVLYSDGELDFDGSPDVVFNAFSGFARYPDWTRQIHVGMEWLDLKTGGIGSRFLLWEKPGERQVMHYGAVTELERNRKFTWRAPFAEWDKVFIGTSMTAEPRPDGGTHVYHVLYIDLPVEYLPIFGGFGTLPGFDLQFETFHIFEEAHGFNQLLRADAFTERDKTFRFDRNVALARDWPLQSGRPWPQEALTLQPDRVITYEQMVVDLAQLMADVIPSPAFMRQYRHLAVTRRYNAMGTLHGRT